MRLLVVLLAAVLLAWGGVTLLPWALLYGSQATLVDGSSFLAVGDSVRFRGLHSWRAGPEIFPLSYQRSSDDGISRFYRWTIQPVLGQARVTTDGVVTGETPGEVTLHARVWGTDATRTIVILPAWTELSSEPATVRVALGDSAELHVRTRFAAPPPAAFSIGVEIGPRGDGVPVRASYDDLIAASVPIRDAESDQWRVTVRGATAGSTSLIVTAASRRLVIPVVVEARSRP